MTPFVALVTTAHAEMSDRRRRETPSVEKIRQESMRRRVHAPGVRLDADAGTKCRSAKRCCGAGGSESRWEGNGRVCVQAPVIINAKCEENA
jgi:hypothetical protein